jgi:small multidrug resistance pump
VAGTLPLIANAVLLASLLTLSHAVLKWVSIQAAGNYLELITRYWWAVGGALLIYGFIFFYYIVVLRSQALSQLYPIYTGLSLLLVTLAGVLFFAESLSLLQVLGAGLIVVGIVLMVGM